MTTLGLNLKWTLGRGHRAAVRAMFAALGVTPVSPADDFDVFTLDEGANIGIDYVSDEEALVPAQMERGAWIELVVGDPTAVAAKLSTLGIVPFAYKDKQHEYFHAPGGQVFRLAKSA